MGAEQFEVVFIGKDAESAFREAVDAATWTYGHGGYTGTIAEKDSFVLVTNPLPPEEWHHAIEFIEHASYNSMDDIPPEYQEWAKKAAAIFADKWGPALGMEITGEAAKKFKLPRSRQKVFVFCGWASS